MDTDFYRKGLELCLRREIKIRNITIIPGGCINHATCVETDDGKYFLKWNPAIPHDMFEKEAMGLQLLSRAGQVKIPEVVGYGELDGKLFLILEFIAISPKDRRFWEKFGVSLAGMHQQSHVAFGLDHDNYIGKLKQVNSQTLTWVDFFIRNRLEVQLHLAIENRLVSGDFISQYRKFYELLPQLLPEEKPSLIHGDLWSGNFMVGPDGLACLIDPAVYYGHREIELAFTTMFGGFSETFYKAYNEAMPLERGWAERFDIYNIYPAMVHANLFGSSYLYSVKAVLNRYVR